MAKCQVEECTDPECEGNPHDLNSITKQDAWHEGHRSAAKHGQVLKRALFNLQTFVRKRGLYQTYLRAQARQKLAKEAKAKAIVEKALAGPEG